MRKTKPRSDIWGLLYPKILKGKEVNACQYCNIEYCKNATSCFKLMAFMLYSREYSPKDNSREYSPKDNSREYFPKDNCQECSPKDNSREYSPKDNYREYSPKDNSREFYNTRYEVNKGPAI
jgi:hypothetical protein